MSLYETLKAAKIGAASDVLTTLRAQQAPFAKGGYTPTEKELEGIPPLSFSANGENLIAYSIDGNFSQTGTPTNNNPIPPSECGELVESGAHSGEYVLPIVCGGSTTNYYMQEPIRKIGNFKDVANNQNITRIIKKLTFTGKESWQVSAAWKKTNTSVFFYNQADMEKTVNNQNIYVFSDRFTSTSRNGLADGDTDMIAKTGSYAMTVRVADSIATTAAEFKEWLSDLNTAGTPVTVWYVLAEAETETVTAPTIPTVNGSNTFNVNTTLAPSSVYIKYKG